MSFFRGLRAPASLQDQEDFEDVESEPLLEAVQRPVSRASLDDPDAGHADMGTGDIEIEDFGFDQLEVNRSILSHRTPISLFRCAHRGHGKVSNRRLIN